MQSILSGKVSTYVRGKKHRNRTALFCLSDLFCRRKAKWVSMKKQQSPESVFQIFYRKSQPGKPDLQRTQC